MAKASEKKSEKKRAEKYEPKVSFDGTFEQLIGKSVEDAEKKNHVNLTSWQNYFSISYDVFNGREKVGEGETFYSSQDPNEKGEFIKSDIKDQIHRDYSSKLSVRFKQPVGIDKDTFDKTPSYQKVEIDKGDN